jgi:putative selenium metabolism hydrolase
LRAFEQVEKNRRALIKFLKKLVKTPSISGKEKELAEIIKSELGELGYNYYSDGMGNVVAHTGRKKGRTILFDTHMDHIQPGNPESWRYPPYGGEVDKGILYGRGSVDMKSAIASVVYGIAAEEQEGEIYISFVVHEETNEGIATKQVIKEGGIKLDACVLGEPTNLKLSIGQRGRAVFKVTTEGMTSHSSMPELGRNAIYLMNPIINNVKEANRRLPEDSFLGKASMAITEIDCQPGGGPIIPDRCSIIIDRRTIPGETLGGIAEDLSGIAEGAEVELIEDEITCFTGFQTKVKQYFPGWVTDQNHWIVTRSLEALKMVLGYEPRIFGWRFSTNGVCTSGEFNIPTIGFGPGDPSLAHQPNEHVSIEDVVVAAKGYASIAKSLCDY